MSKKNQKKNRVLKLYWVEAKKNWALQKWKSKKQRKMKLKN